MKTDLFQNCGHCWVFQICWHIEWSTFNYGKSCDRPVKTLPPGNTIVPQYLRVTCSRCLCGYQYPQLLKSLEVQWIQPALHICGFHIHRLKPLLIHGWLNLRMQKMADTEGRLYITINFEGREKCTDIDLCLPRGWGREEKEWELGISRGKVLYRVWINNKVLLYSTGNYIQYLMTNHNGKECKKEYIYTYICMYNWITLQNKWIQHCKSTILQ